MKDYENLYIGDNLKILQSFRTSSIDLVVTSPPYDNARNYDGFPPLTISRIRKLGKEIYRVLDDRGVLCWNVNDMADGFGGESLNSFRQALIFQKIGFHVKPIIWEKSVFNPNKKFYYDVKEYVFICHKGNYTFNPIEDVKSVQNIRFGEYTRRSKDGTFRKVEKNVEIKRSLNQEYMRKRGNVWKGNTAAQEKPCQKLYGHAPMPEWLVRDLVISFSNEGDIVLDPFSGGGTTWEVCEKLNRKSVNIEISRKIAEESLERMKHVNPVML
jgi:site-specific DNA-methyltransferase (adenine-specific)